MRLEPLTVAHVDDLVDAAGDNRETYDWTTVPHGAGGVERYVDGCCSTLAGRGGVGAVHPGRGRDRRAVGMTNYLTLRFDPGADLPYAVEVGGTWLAHSAQRTGINVEAKLLLFTHAFETWGVGRVDLKTDARNARSGTRSRGLARSSRGSCTAGSRRREGRAGLLRGLGDVLDRRRGLARRPRADRRRASRATR